MTVLSKHFGFVHVPRTGGTWAARVLLTQSPPEWGVRFGSYHAAASELPSELPLFAFVRNPWDWYVSFVHVWRDHYIGRTGWHDATGTLVPGFAPPEVSWVPAVRWWAERFRRVGTEFGPLVRSLISENTRQSLSVFVGQAGAQTRFGRYEGLRTELPRLLRELGLDPSRIATAAAAEPVLHSAQRGGYRDYYDAALRELVAHAEAPVISRFGYEF